MKSVLLFLLVFACSLNGFAQQTYTTSFETEEEQNEWTLFQLGPEQHDIYRWEFVSFGGIDGDISMAHYYPVGGEEVSDDWIVSPTFDFFGGGEITSISYQFNGFGTPFGVDTVALYLITGNVNPDLATEKILLRLYSDEEYMNDGIIRMDTNIEIPAIGGESYLAFRYKTIINWLDVKFDALELTYTPMASNVSSTLQNVPVHIFPNPATTLLNIETPENSIISSIEIYDIQGRLVLFSSENNKNVNIVSLNSGTYVARIKTDTSDSTRKFVVE